MLTKSEVKYIQSLQQKKFRDEQGIFVAEGPKLVKELLDSGHFRCQELFVTEEMTEWTQGLSIRPRLISSAELERISGLQTPNAMLALFEKNNPAEVDPAGKITLLLDDIQDPGNLGTIIRTADWFGVRNIVASTSTADCYNSKVVQSTMASLGRVNILYTEPEAWVRQYPDLPVFAASPQGSDIRTIQPPAEGILIIGNESKGIRHALMGQADQLLKIPGKGTAESLNAAVAAGILMFWLNGN
jgi:TrmH family RNA methyltransferase